MIGIGSGEWVILLGEKPSPAEKRAAELFGERVRERSGVALAAPGGKAAVRLAIGTAASNDRIREFAGTHPEVAALGADGFCLVTDTANGAIYVAGQNDSGVVAGVGRLLREMRYLDGRIEIPALRIAETPRMPNRGIYLWARKHFFDKPDQLDRYIEEFALWGGNAISFWFEMGLFNNLTDTSIQDAKTGFHDEHRNRLSPQEWLGLYRRFYATARRMGMKTGLLMCANDAYRTSPQASRITPIIGCPDWYMCPSKPGAVEQMVAWQAEVFKALAPIDIFNIFPADAGGCACKECTPWPTQGFWRVAKPLGERIHEISPKTEIWVDTWHLNHPTFGGKDWIKLVETLDATKMRPEWFAGFEVGVAPHHPYAAMSAEERERYNKANQPLMVFPDISMWGNHPGMLVNKAYWTELQAELNGYHPELMKGGWPYSERWNTDIVSVMFLSWFWNSKQSVDTVLDEYASFYFGSEAATGRQLLELLDDGNKDPERPAKIRATLSKLEASLPAWVKNDWRWQEIVTSCQRFRNVRIVLPAQADEQMKKAVAVFARQVESRCPAKVVTSGAAPVSVTLAIDPGLGPEGFRISDRGDGKIEVAGQNERGVLYGLGKLLRTSRYDQGGCTPGNWRGTSVPQKSRRGIYFATHFHNYYHEAPVEEIDRYVEDLALWGFNELVVWYDAHHFNGFEDPEAVKFRKRLHDIMVAAKRIGMDVSLVVIGNEAYGNSPAELRATPGAGRGGYYPCAVCPSKPEGMQYILKILGEWFDGVAELKPRAVWIWPYDQGGCGCAECMPWGSKGFMKCIREVGKLVREKLPGTEIFLSTWFLDKNECQGVKEQLAGEKKLVDGIISEPGPHGLPIKPEEHGLPMVGFPEISMHETFPWGGFGATPLTARARAQWNVVKATHAGGFPYSEGIYEDLTKVVYSQLYWSDRPEEETVREYIAYEFSPDVVEDVAGVITTLERNHHWRWWPGKLEGVKLEMNWFPSRGAKPQADPGAEEAYAAMQRVDKRLSARAKQSWRWRQLYLRALLDSELKTNGGTPNDACNQAFAELIEIYHAQNAEPHVRPPLPKNLQSEDH